MHEHHLSPSSERWFYGTLLALMFLAPLLFLLTQGTSITGDAVAVQDSKDSLEPQSLFSVSTGEIIYWSIFLALIVLAVVLFFLLSGK